MSHEPTTTAMFAPYRVIRRLGHGMQGEAFLADTPHGTRVVIKVLHTAHPRDRRAMDTEIAALRAVGPAFGPRVVEYRLAADRPCLVMEYLEGDTVAALLATGPLDEADTFRLAIRLATLLAGIHDVGVAHGDFRPQNLILAREGLYAIDFGCARLRADSRRDFQHRRRMDLLHLGVLIARAATGRVPFGEDWSKAIEDYHDRNLDLGSMPVALRPLTRALLSPTAWCRPSARTVRDTLLRRAPRTTTS